MRFSFQKRCSLSAIDTRNVRYTLEVLPTNEYGGPHSESFYTIQIINFCH
jgi:hypothetical protein